MRREISSFYRGFLESRLACPSVRDGTPRRAGWAAIGATEVTDALEPDGGGCARRWRLTYCRTSSRLERGGTPHHDPRAHRAGTACEQLGQDDRKACDAVPRRGRREGVRQGDPDVRPRR